MAKGGRGRRRSSSRQLRPSPYPLPYDQDILENLCPKKCSRDLMQKDWEDATCSVCMEYPHNAVLLLCSSHDKGCRPYMCGTSFRHSNCLDQYKKAYTKMVSFDQGQPMHASNNNPIEPESGWPIQKCEVTELACPLCRGKVKGWTVLEPARDYLNAKKRSCMQENCSFVGNYKELRRHVRAEHPSARPREVNPAHEQKWRRLEHERETDDVISTIQSSMPGAMFFGDYVIEGNNYEFDTDEEDGGFDAEAAARNGGFELGFDGNLVNVFFLLHAFGSSGPDLSRRMRQPERALHHPSDVNAVSFRQMTPIGSLDSSEQDDENDGDGDGDGDDGDGGMSLVNRLRRHGRVLLNRSGRRRRRREGNSDI